LTTVYLKQECFSRDLPNPLPALYPLPAI